MDMKTMSTDPTLYWVFWWIFTLAVYAGFAIWWRWEIKAADQKNAEKFERLKQYREEQLSTSEKLND